jgi:hypothetical protein
LRKDQILIWCEFGIHCGKIHMKRIQGLFTHINKQNSLKPTLICLKILLGKTNHKVISQFMVGSNNTIEIDYNIVNNRKLVTKIRFE